VLGQGAFEEIGAYLGASPGPQRRCVRRLTKVRHGFVSEHRVEEGLRCRVHDSRRVGAVLLAMKFPGLAVGQD
jgi:hypothetical protein